jgi:hypothetical protein
LVIFFFLPLPSLILLASWNVAESYHISCLPQILIVAHLRKKPILL